MEDTRYKTFWRRLGANLIDGLIIGFASMIVAIPIFVVVFFAAMDPEGGAGELTFGGVIVMVGTLLALQVGTHAYTILMLWKYGQTVGKMATGIVVRRADSGLPIGLREAFMRSAGEIALQVSYVFIVVAGAAAGASGDAFRALDTGHSTISLSWWFAEVVTMLTNPRRRALHDLFAGTVVLKKKFETNDAPLRLPDGVETSPGWQHSALSTQHSSVAPHTLPFTSGLPSPTLPSYTNVQIRSTHGLQGFPRTGNLAQGSRHLPRS